MMRDIPDPFIFHRCIKESATPDYLLCGSCTASLGPGLDLYAHNLGEDNSTVIG